MFMYNRSLLVSVSHIFFLLFHMSSKWFVGFVDGSSHHTCNLASAVWAIYAPSRQLVASGGACLGLATNNMVEYSVVIELLWDAMLCGITYLDVGLDSRHGGFTCLPISYHVSSYCGF